MQDVKIHKFWWLWLPFAVLALQISIEATLPRSEMPFLYDENGLQELTEFFIISAAFVIAWQSLCKLNLKKQTGLGLWIGLAAICSFYVAGEEVSWGQHFLSWATPEFWTRYNDQYETNLHNISSWFDQKPRAVLICGVIIGGLIIPLLKKYAPSTLPQKFAIIYPTAIFIPLALILILVKTADKIAENMNMIIFWRYSEFEELLLFYFVLLYLVMMKRRISNL